MYRSRLGQDVTMVEIPSAGQPASADWITSFGRIVGIAGAAAVVGKEVFGKKPSYSLSPQTPYFRPGQPPFGQTFQRQVPVTQQAWFWPVVIGGGSLGLLLLTTFMKK